MPSARQLANYAITGRLERPVYLCGNSYEVRLMLQRMDFMERMATRLAEPGAGSWGEFWEHA